MSIFKYRERGLWTGSVPQIVELLAWIVLGSEFNPQYCRGEGEKEKKKKKGYSLFSPTSLLSFKREGFSPLENTFKSAFNWDN
jgi:hypothetical protein